MLFKEVSLSDLIFLESDGRNRTFVNAAFECPLRLFQEPAVSIWVLPMSRTVLKMFPPSEPRCRRQKR